MALGDTMSPALLLLFPLAAILSTFLSSTILRRLLLALVLLALRGSLLDTLRRLLPEILLVSNARLFHTAVLFPLGGLRLSVLLHWLLRLSVAALLHGVLAASLRVPVLVPRPVVRVAARIARVIASRTIR